MPAGRPLSYGKQTAHPDLSVAIVDSRPSVLQSIKPDDENRATRPSPSLSPRLSPLMPLHSTSDASNHSRSSSRCSERSHVTLTEDDSTLLGLDDISIDNGSSMSKSTWRRRDHFWAAISIFPRKAEVEPDTPKRSVQNATSAEDEEMPSPWILPVYVLSPRVDYRGDTIRAIAQCTIDTGNMQGNTMSRSFYLDVLGFDVSTIEPLNSRERAGRGYSITGQEVVADGAAYLTWFHKNSTKVFRDMRFLIIDNAPFDLIIGAHSIQKHRLLSKPNFAAKNTKPKNNDKFFTNKQPSSEVLKSQQANLRQLESDKSEIERRIHNNTASPADHKSLAEIERELKRVSLETSILDAVNDKYLPAQKGQQVAERVLESWRRELKELMDM